MVRFCSNWSHAWGNDISDCPRALVLVIGTSAKIGVVKKSHSSLAGVAQWLRVDL